MTKALSNTPLWPYIGVVSCLLILTLLSPRSWKHVDDGPIVSESVRSQPTLAVAVIASPQSDMASRHQVDAEVGGGPQPHNLATSPTPQQVTMDQLPSLYEFQAPRQIARISPPVTEQVKFDPSFGHAPSLPAPETIPEAPRVEIAPLLASPPASLDRVNVSVPRKAAETAPHVSTFWPMPRNLAVRLEQVAEIEGCAEWADHVRFALEQLHQSESPHSSAATGSGKASMKPSPWFLTS